MEFLVWGQLNEFLEQHKEICDCEKCRYDMAALALNNLPPRYVASEKGELMMKVQSTFAQSRSDVLSALIKASMKVSEHPNH
jgi:competence protein ComFB